MLKKIKNYFITRREVNKAAKENLTYEQYRLWKRSGRLYGLDYQSDILRLMW